MKRFIPATLIATLSIAAATATAHPLEIQSGDCSYKTSIDGDRLVIDIEKGESKNAYFSLPLDILPLEDGRTYNVSRDSSTDESLTYRNGILRYSSQGHTDFLEGQKVRIAIDPDLTTPSNVEALHSITVFPVEAFVCRFE